MIRSAGDSDDFSELLSRTYNLKISKHTIIDEKNPFLLYAIEIKSNYSKYVVLKQFKNFVRLQQEVSSNSISYSSNIISFNI